MPKKRLPGAGDYDLATYGGRLSLAIAYAGMPVQQVAEALGVTSSAVSQQCASTRPEGGPRHRNTLAQVLRVPLQWLAFGVGPGPEGLGSSYDGPNERDLPRVGGAELAKFPEKVRAAPNPGHYELDTFGGRLNYAIARTGRTATEVAEALGITRSAVHQLCSSTRSDGGGRQPQRLAELLGVPVRWLTHGLGSQPGPVIESRASFSVDQSTLPGPLVLTSDNLTLLQMATLQKLHAAMKEGCFNEKACLGLLTELDKRSAA